MNEPTPEDIDAVRKQLAETANDPHLKIITCSCVARFRDGKDCGTCELYIRRRREENSYCAVYRYLNKG